MPVSQFNQSLGETVRAYRKQAGISQALLAERAGVTRRFIQELENGRSDISLHTLFALSSALDFTLGEICSHFESRLKASGMQ